MQLALPTALPLPPASFSPLLPLSHSQLCVDLGSTPPLPPVLTEAEKIRDREKRRLTMQSVPNERVLRGDAGLILHFVAGKTPALYYACPHYTEEEASDPAYRRYRLLSLFALPNCYFTASPLDMLSTASGESRRNVPTPWVTRQIAQLRWRPSIHLSSATFPYVFSLYDNPNRLRYHSQLQALRQQPPSDRRSCD